MSVRLIKASALVPSGDQQAAGKDFPFDLGSQGVHEVTEAVHGDWTAAMGFALHALRKTRPASVLWVSQPHFQREHGPVYAQGLYDWLRPARPALLSVSPSKASECLWVIEEAIQSGVLSLVVAETGPISFTASRRLSLASERHGTPVILLMPYGTQGSTAAQARWRITALPSAPNPFDDRAPGRARWQATLERCRTAPHATGHVFTLSADDEPLSLPMADGLAPYPMAPGAANEHAEYGWFRGTG
ncbi:hypothetical protein [Parvularcula sp. LCG005]|uniref:ImuA family protein n=1 Tax=Parvularcula sp. LCG005 TaxID=3078805 RepID=UPI002942AE1A|nr:hypothetical protein [Parvularcula sp. LCG005]WOI52664.1 hypothetical protein RUI03_10955 [Parvularcula sp. LCG005]